MEHRNTITHTQLWYALPCHLITNIANNVKNMSMHVLLQLISGKYSKQQRETVIAYIYNRYTVIEKQRQRLQLMSCHHVYKQRMYPLQSKNYLATSQRTTQCQRTTTISFSCIYVFDANGR